MRVFPFLLLIFVSAQLFAQTHRPIPSLPQKKDTAATTILFVITLTKEDYAETIKWIQSSGRHTGEQCQDYTDFLRANTKIIQDTTRKK